MKDKASQIAKAARERGVAGVRLTALKKESNAGYLDVASFLRQGPVQDYPPIHGEQG